MRITKKIVLSAEDILRLLVSEEILDKNDVVDSVHLDYKRSDDDFQSILLKAPNCLVIESRRKES
jgi:hypothetical protein